MKHLLSSEDDLSLVLKHAIANGAINVQREYGQGGKSWSLIELTGTVCLVHGLTFKRGGFLEKNVDYLRESAASPDAQPLEQLHQTGRAPCRKRVSQYV